MSSASENEFRQVAEARGQAGTRPPGPGLLGKGLCPSSLGRPPWAVSMPLSLASSFSVATRIEQRKKMNCKSFRWYLDNVYPELT